MIKTNDLVRVKEGNSPLFVRGDLFRVVKLNKDKDLMPIFALRLKDKQTYGFFQEELEHVQKKQYKK